MEHLLADAKTWIALSFFGFMFLLFRFAWKPITSQLDARADTIRNELEEAVKLREAAQTLLSEYQTRQKEMEAEAASILAAAKEEVVAMRKLAEKNLAEAMERRTKLAHDRIARAESEALADIQSIMVSASVKAAKQLAIKELDDKRRSELLSEALSDAKRLIH